MGGMRRKKSGGKRWAAIGCLVFISLSGCGSLSDRLIRQANHYAEGKQEEAYYLQPSLYRMKVLLADYTDEYRRCVWESVEGDGERPEGWAEDSVVSSDECISSARELEGVLVQAMETAALGIELHFDRGKYLPSVDEIEQWILAYADRNPIDALGLEKVTERLSESVSERTVYLVLQYQLGREDILSLRNEVRNEAEKIVREIAPNENRAEADKLEAVWQYMTGQVTYPEKTGEDAHPSWYRADGALLGKKATGEGYALAAKALLDELGLENEVIAEEQEEAGRYRFYNRVCADGVWYRMDCCFGAATDGNRDFFWAE